MSLLISKIYPYKSVFLLPFSFEVISIKRQMVQTIGFIGVGLIGSDLARLAVNAGYKVALSNSREPESLSNIITELGGDKVASATTPKGIAEDKNIELVVLTVPLKVIPTLVPAIGGLKNKIVIDTNNYYPFRDGQIEVLDTRKLTTAEYVGKYLDSSARQVKVFNNIFAIHLLPAASKDPSAQTCLPIMSDDKEASRVVSEFVRNIGFKTTFAGSLKDSWRAEPKTPVYCTPYAPCIPEGLNEQEAVEYFMSHCAAPLSAEAVEVLIKTATTEGLVGGIFGPNSIPGKATVLAASR